MPSFYWCHAMQKNNQLIEWSAEPNTMGIEFKFTAMENPNKSGQTVIDIIQNPMSGNIGQQILHLIEHNSSLQGSFYYM